MIKFLFTRILISTSLFLMISCNNNSQHERSEDADLNTIDSVTQVPDSSTFPALTASSEQLKGVTVEQRDLNEIFKSISSKELTEEEQKILIKEYQDSIKLHTPSKE
ncbi:hypothetical protein [Albibacterium profundi]|uniref:Lipoprotein n=1 Tax=Albibacterium profundi TaxID=3134906 RepID=A0ABV5CHL4_9SPHI